MLSHRARYGNPHLPSHYAIATVGLIGRTGAPSVHSRIGWSGPLASSTLAEMTAQSRKARITALVAKAEREVRAGRLPEAVFAYSDAFDLERDPRIGGRLGVLLVQLDNAVVAADLLMNALERARDAPASERFEFFKAFEVAQSRVCRLEVTVSEAHAKILLDGRVTQEDGITGFAMYVAPGEHNCVPNSTDSVMPSCLLQQQKAARSSSI